MNLDIQVREESMVLVTTQYENGLNFIKNSLRGCLAWPAGCHPVTEKSDRRVRIPLGLLNAMLYKRLKYSDLQSDIHVISRGSNPPHRTKCSVRLVVRTKGFHPLNTVSITVPSTKFSMCWNW